MLLILYMQKIEDFKMTLEHTEDETTIKLQRIGRYFLAKCGELPKGRLVKLFYLLDWKSALKTGNTITNLTWYYNHYGPFLPEVIDTLLNTCNDIFLHSGNNRTGAPAEYICLQYEKTDGEKHLTLSLDEKQLADEVIQATKDLNFTQFIKLVYSTFPIRSSQKYSQLDLVNLAHIYKEDSSCSARAALE
jgi:uncharacterized protein YwgA